MMIKLTEKGIIIMLRYIRVNNNWVDTLEAQKQGITYMVIDGSVITMDSQGNETYLGHLQGERD